MQHLIRHFLIILFQCLLLLLSGCGEANKKNESTGDIVEKPNTPVNFVAVAGAGNVSLSWKIEPNTNYIIYWSTDRNFRFDNAEGVIANAEPTYVHDDLNPEKKYFYTVVAVIGKATSFASIVVSASPIGNTLLSPPENIEIHPGDLSNHLTWNASPGALQYLVYWTEDQNEDPENSNKPVLLLETTELDHRFLKNNATIYYRLRSKSENILSPFSEIIQGTPQASSLTPPNNVRVKTYGDISVIVEWDSVISANGYTVYWSDVSRDFNLASANSAPLSADAKEFVLSNLTANTTYYLVVKAFDDFDVEGPASYVLEIPFAVGSTTPTNPPPDTKPPVQQPVLLAPKNIVVTVDDGVATINWQADNASAAYQLFFAIKTGVKKSNYNQLSGGFASDIVLQTRYVTTKLEIATTYFFSIISILESKESKESIEQFFQVMIPEVLYNNASAELGASIYEQWWSGTSSQPKIDSPLWSKVEKNIGGVAFNSAENADTWRCAECHGWDYKGKSGLYGNGSSHYTGFVGVDEAAATKSKEEIYQFILSGETADGVSHAFDKIRPDDLLALTKFVKENTANATGYWQGSAESGIAKYNENNASNKTCNESSCHPDRNSESFGKVYLLNFALSEPGRFTHYVRFGVGRMPGGPTISDASDIIAYLWEQERTGSSSNFSLADYDNIATPVDEQWALGGRLYDRWILARTVVKDAIPAGNHPLWPSVGTVVNGADTWRCKECHGWDYRGKNGAYSKGIHFTGIDGVINSSPKYSTPKEIYDFIRSGDLHALQNYLADEDIYALTRFIINVREEAKNNTSPSDLIDTKNEEPLTFDLVAGRKQYRTTSSNGGCRSCHRKTSSSWSFSDSDPSRSEIQNVATIARQNPWEFLHKIRFGHPGSTMGGIVENRKDELKFLKPAIDILAYSQTNLYPDIKRGGRLYDTWWQESQLLEPSRPHVLTPVDSGLSIVESWRCESCHGWDYQGKFGIKPISGSTVDVAEFLTSGTVTNPSDHAFSGILKNADIADLNFFFSDAALNGVRDDIQTLLMSGDSLQGQTLYESVTPGNCINCHGDKGTSIPNVDLRFAAENNAALVMHKSRFGSPGSLMKPTISQFTGLSATDAANIPTYVQTLVSSAGGSSSGTSLDRGGRLFDNWFREMQVNDSSVQVPASENPLWTQRNTNIPDVQSIVDTWRCVTCHKWNYKGIDLLQSAPDADNLIFKLKLRRESLGNDTDFVAYLFNWIKAGTSTQHNYGSIDSGLTSPLGDTEIEDLVLFLQQGVIDTSAYLHSIDGKPVIANPQRGKQLYQGEILTEINCESCHGPSGESIPVGGTNPVDIFALANQNAWKFLHKVRFSSIDTPMPALSGISGNQIEDAIDLLAYAQQSFAQRQ